MACSLSWHFIHLSWINAPRAKGGLGRLDIPLLSDLTHSISKDYGVFLEKYGNATEPYYGMHRNNGQLLPSLFIINNKGVLRHFTINDLSVGHSVDESLRLVQAFQYANADGEVCLSSWKPRNDALGAYPKYTDENLAHAGCLDGKYL